MLPLLAFCNDIDFSDWATYQEVHLVLREEYGLPAEDSFWLFDPSGSEMALFKRSPEEKGPRHDELLEEIAKGRLTILHGGGNFSRSNTDLRPSRSLIGTGLAYVKEHASVPTIWTNHGDEGDIQNIGGAAPTYHEGDDPTSPAYLIDLLLQGGVRFFWTDHHASNSFTFSPTESGGQPLLVKERTRSGHEILCFFRYRGALPKAPDAQNLGLQLSPQNLDHLVKTGGVTVIYQHWGVHRNAEGRPRTASRPIFPAESLIGLRRLQHYRDRGLIRVVPLTELLVSCANHSEEHGCKHS